MIFVAPMLVLLGLVVVCASISYQSYGFVALFTSRLVARTVFGFTIPPAWFTALNPITIMFLTPLLLALWRRGGIGARWTEVQRIAAGLVAMAIGFTPLVAAALQARGGQLASPLWVAFAIMLIASSELLYSPAALSAATRLAPKKYQTLAVGAQGSATGLGGWVSGQLGALAFESDKALVMGAISGTALAFGALLFASRRWFSRLDL
jgi:POT family proton-dependent oligopeptide transporter